MKNLQQLTSFEKVRTILGNTIETGLSEKSLVCHSYENLNNLPKFGKLRKVCIKKFHAFFCRFRHDSSCENLPPLTPPYQGVEREQSLYDPHISSSGIGVVEKPNTKKNTFIQKVCNGLYTSYQRGLERFSVQKTKILLIVLLIMCTNSGNLFSSFLPSRTNIAITDTLLKNYITKLADFIKEKKITTINFIDNKTEETRYLEQLLLSECTNKGISLSSAISDSVNNSIKISIKELKIRYTNHELNEDSLNREFIIDISGILSNAKTGTIEPVPTFATTYNDIISRNDLEFIRNYEFRFANPDVPERPGSWLRDIAQPIVIIAAAATTIVLLFTVRSK